MILKLILSDATYDFEIRFFAVIHYQKTCIGPKTILSVERSVCWRVSPKVSIRLSAPILIQIV